MIHELKIWPEYFDAVVSGEKTFEVRRRRMADFRVGDMLDLREVDMGSSQYTGRSVSVDVTYVLPIYKVFDGLHDLVVMSIRVRKDPGSETVNWIDTKNAEDCPIHLWSRGPDKEDWEHCVKCGIRRAVRVWQQK